jgi:hypothetical protein
MVSRIRRPSRQVFSLLSEPSGRLRLGLEADRVRGERLDETPRKRAITGQHVAEGAAEQRRHAAREQLVAETVAGPVSRALRRDPRADHHVEPVRDERLHEHRRRGRVVGTVAVDHHVHVGLDVREHPPDHVALAPVRHRAHRRARGARDAHRVVGRVVVEYVDAGVGQRPPEIVDDLADRDRLVVARHEHGDVQFPRGHRLIWRWFYPSIQRVVLVFHLGVSAASGK